MEVRTGMGLFAWDRGLDYEKEYRRLLRLYRQERRKARKANLLVLLTALRNGARVSEAIEFLKKVLQTGKRELEIPVKKQKKPVTRPMVLPREIDVREVRELAYWVMNRTRQKVYSTAKSLGYNPHALRYAFISHLAKRGVSAQLIAKITGHRKLDYILHYTQKKRAEEILLEMDAWKTK